MLIMVLSLFLLSSRRRHTRCALVTGVQTCALPIWGNDMANRTDIDTFENLNDVSRTIMADGLIGGKRFADIIIEIMQIAAAYGADEARRSAHFFATPKETDFDKHKAEIVLSATRTLFQNGNIEDNISIPTPPPPP